ncbi:MAG: hypothetical protein ACI9LL_000804 [Porticoccus sp.]
MVYIFYTSLLIALIHKLTPSVGLFGKKSPEDLKNQTLTTEEGDHYIGEIKGGHAHGQGTFTSAGLYSYVGEYKDGKRHGNGTVTWSGGSTYIGAFKDDKYYGVSIWTDHKGKVGLVPWVADIYLYDSGEYRRSVKCREE